MKSLQQHLNEALVVESYKAQFSAKEWDDVLSKFKPTYSNYSQLGGLEDHMRYEETDEECAEEWIDGMVANGCPSDKRDVLKDIFMWFCDHYETDTLGWRDDTEWILDKIKGLDSTEWGVSMEDYACFVEPTKKLSGNDKKLGEVLAKYGASGDLEDIAAQYENGEY